MLQVRSPGQSDKLSYALLLFMSTVKIPSPNSTLNLLSGSNEAHLCKIPFENRDSYLWCHNLCFWCVCVCFVCVVRDP